MKNYEIRKASNEKLIDARDLVSPCIVVVGVRRRSTGSQTSFVAVFRLIRVQVMFFGASSGVRSWFRLGRF